MLCPICKKETKDNSKFCVCCGNKIPRCPTCGKVLMSRARFCKNDGTPIPEELLALLPEATQKTTPSKQSTEESASATSRRDTPAGGSSVSSANTGTYTGGDSASSANTGTYTGTSVKPQITGSSMQPSQKKKSAAPIIIAVVVVVLVLAGAATAGYFLFGDELLQTARQTDSADTLAAAGSASPDADMLEESASAAASEAETPSATETAVPTPSPTPKPTPTPTAAAETATPTSAEDDALLYFILNSDSMYFTTDDIKSFDADMCRLARNGIYARLGRKFADETLTAYFSQYDWYTPTIEPDNFSEDLLNAYQIANRDLIVAFEEEQGYR